MAGPPDRTAESPHTRPRWVKVVAALTALVVILIVVVMILGGGKHGPGQHLGGDDARQTAPQSGGEGGHKPPAGGHGP